MTGIVDESQSCLLMLYFLVATLELFRVRDSDVSRHVIDSIVDLYRDVISACSFI